MGAPSSNAVNTGKATGSADNEGVFLNVLKRVALRRDRNASQVRLDDVRQALRHFQLEARAIREVIAPILEPQPIDSAPAQELADLLGHHLPLERKLTMEEPIKVLVMQLAQSTHLVLRHQSIWRHWTAHALYNRLYSAAATVPGQADAARELAILLFSQLTDPERTVTTRALLHGAQGSGTWEMAQAVSQAFAAEGYAVLRLDCTAYRSEGEAASLTGSKSYWGGSKPGEVTGFIHRHPRAVVLFRYIDQTLPAVMATLRDALQTGVLTDEFGLEEGPGGGRKDRDDTRPPTQVDCSKAVFLFVASEGAEWHEHPDAAQILGTTERARKTSIIHALHSAQREHRGEWIPRFDRIILGELAPYLVLFEPPTWSVLLEQTIGHLPDALALCQERLERTVQMPKGEMCRDLALVHLLTQGGNAGLAHTTARSLYKTLFFPVETAALHHAAMSATPWKKIGLTRLARRQLHAIKQELGEKPLLRLRRRSLFLEYQWRISKQGLWIDALKLSSQRTLADYGGSVALLSRVPEQRLEQVAGHMEVQRFFREMIGYLRNPGLLRRLGVEMPKGCLLYGPPGTGKTFLAQAFAGEADVPFLAVSGAELLHPERLERVYQLAKRNAPAVIYIDEADALGQRGRSLVHDTAINTLLREIQGFSSNAAIFHILSTNRPDELDAALLRSGRIDRRFYIGPLDRAGRALLVERFLTLLPPTGGDLADVREQLLQFSSGMTGADLEQVRREAALRAHREGQTVVPLAVLLEEFARLKYGANEQRAVDPAKRHRVAVHEAGHALVHYLLLGAQWPIEHISIIPRGESEGFMAVNGEDARWLAETPAAVHAYIAVLLGGRASELLYFGDEGPSNGAGNDLARATEAAWKAVTQGGLDEAFGPLSLRVFDPLEHAPPAVLEKAWERVRHWIAAGQNTALQLLRTHRASLEVLLEALLKKETLNGAEIAELIEQSRFQRHGTGLNPFKPLVEAGALS